ncbi:glutathione S-transferase [Litorimonas cladophorae]|uniref:Glutathione S-transferase n=1 Tax=Litorimonas cladophorae TaxID=1220491 RepID=A0A918KEK0_9PROT|nr:glutathione S-transferase N-terminal domain-containing protein [Litorimonas cladophorae]GGX59399.1 glutathione S-transferase [Litorimonas cladophorae]
MKLICSPISPYARKVMILARLSHVELEEVEPQKAGANGYLAGDNPLGKIPALEWQPGQFLFDSPVICQYLDSLREEPLLPEKGHARFIQLWQHALGDGLSDAVYNYRYETVRPAELHWDEMIERHDRAIRNAIATLEKISPWLGASWTFGNIAIICGLDYASYRASHFNWQQAHPDLAAWHAALTDDPIWRETYAYGMTSG